MVNVPTNPRHSCPYHRTHGQTSSPWPGRPRTRHSRCGRPSVDENTFPISNILINQNALLHKLEVYQISYCVWVVAIIVSRRGRYVLLPVNALQWKVTFTRVLFTPVNHILQ